MPEMTVREKKEYLSSFRTIQRNMEEDKKRLEELREIALSIQSMPLNGMPHKPGHPETASFVYPVNQLADMENLIEKTIALYIERRRNIYESINTLKKIDEKLVITMRYIDGYEWYEIQRRLNLSERTVYRLHSDALNHIRIIKSPKKSRRL